MRFANGESEEKEIIEQARQKGGNATTYPSFTDFIALQ